MTENAGFNAFFNSYKTGARSQTRSVIDEVSYYAEQKLLWMAMQIESVHHEVNFLSTYHRRSVNMKGDFIVYRYGAYFITYTRTGCVFIEVPTIDRAETLQSNSFEQYKIRRIRDRDRETSYNNDYIIANTGMVIFRDIHDEFYDLQYAGDGYGAIKYALNVLGVNDD